MVVVYVWNYRGKNVAWGHASMQCGDKYISWWPEPYNRVPRTKIAPQIYDAHPFVLRKFEDDVRDEGMRPDWTIRIEGLDEEAIKGWWKGFNPQAHDMYGPPSAPWSTITSNCSKIVALALDAGGGQQYAPYQSSRNVIWTPNDVRIYAQAVQAGVAAARTASGARKAPAATQRPGSLRPPAPPSRTVR
jgi:hypothetical protein